jgi:hypothetical protein
MSLLEHAEKSAPTAALPPGSSENMLHRPRRSLMIDAEVTPRQPNRATGARPGLAFAEAAEERDAGGEALDFGVQLDLEVAGGSARMPVSSKVLHTDSKPAGRSPDLQGKLHRQ